MGSPVLSPITDEIIRIRHLVAEHKPLVHCLTNHISINQAANTILSVGASPIMAEYPGEVRKITESSRSLLVNLGNISFSRMRSMMISGRVAKKRMIPVVLDLVGVTCSKTRLEFAKRFIEKNRPIVVKGNASELNALIGLPHTAVGVDAGENDITESVSDYLEFVRHTAQKLHVTLLVSGKTDFISNGNYHVAILNGCDELGKITGTGCMLGALCAAFITFGASYTSATLAAAIMGICGEKAKAQNPAGLASFQTALLDNISTLTDMDIINGIKIG